MASELTPVERALRARIAANERIARPGYDGKQATSAATGAYWSRYYDAVDPEGILPKEERDRRAKAKWQADMARAKLARSRERRKRKS